MCWEGGRGLFLERSTRSMRLISVNDEMMKGKIADRGILIDNSKWSGAYMHVCYV